jgi:serine protein kinase
MKNIIEGYKSQYVKSLEEEMSLEEFLALAKRDPMTYASPAERMLAAIGEPETFDTRNDPRLSRLFSNRPIRRYPAFEEFYGMEDVIGQIVAFFKHAAQGLEERKQILYLLGPVGGGKSSIAERLKSLMESSPIYALKGSPVNESPLGLFAPDRFGATLEGSCPPGPSSVCANSKATSPSSASCACSPRYYAR